MLLFPAVIGRTLNGHKTFRRRLLNVLCTFNLHPVSTGLVCLELLLNLGTSIQV